MKIVSFTTSKEELVSLLPFLRWLYFQCGWELLSLVATSEEATLKANPVTHRSLREYASRPLPKGYLWTEPDLLEAIRHALLEERPCTVLLAPDSPYKKAIIQTLEEFGIAHFSLSGKPFVEEAARLTAPRQPKVSITEHTPTERFLEPHWPSLGQVLRSPCLIRTTPEILELCRARLPHIDLHPQPELDRYRQALSLLALSSDEQPAPVLGSLSERADRVFSLEPVNSPLAESRRTFCYRLYDNEFAITPADTDLSSLLLKGSETVVWGARSGQAGPGPVPHPDGRYPAFFSTWPGESRAWTDRFSLPPDKKLKIVFADSGNVAASALYHCEAVNRFTDSEAWALATSPHPFLGPQECTDRIFFTGGQSQPEARLREVLSEADCIVFFEDDDEYSDNWSFPLHRYLEGVTRLHLYIGYRVHARTPELARPGRTILTPLPHLLKMYAGSHFYAGFPPPLKISSEVPPLSTQDGICRFLHTPSLPHWTTSRYLYHKDTEAYLQAARLLKARYGSRVEFHQVGGWSQKQVSKVRLMCDVTFNQLRGYHGLSGDEAMMLGRPCVQAFDQLNINRHLEYWGLDVDFPWISSQRERLADTFEELLVDPQKRAEIGNSSRHFMKRYFSAEKGILPLLYHCYRATRGGSSD